MIMSKDEERAILAKMRKLAENAVYIKTAFEGAWGIAESNIDDDAACSVQWHITEACRQSQEILKLKKQLTDVIQELEGKEQALNREVYAKCLLSSELSETTEKLHEAAKAAAGEIARQNETLNAQAAELEAKDREINALKAKLYDLLVAGRQQTTEAKGQ